MSDICSDNELRELLKKQQQRIENLEKRVYAAEKQVEAAELYSRQDCLILRGKVNVRPNCSLRDEVTRLLQYHTGVQIPQWCLNTVHWLGRGDSIIVRFNNKGVREAIYRNRVPKDVNKRGLFIHESLTSTKVQTVSKCAKLRREGKIVTYYTQSGHVYVKKTKESVSLLLPDHLSEQEILDMLDKQPASYREAVIHREGTDVQGGEREGGRQGMSLDVNPSDTVMPSTVEVTPTLGIAVATASDTTHSTPDVQTLTTSTDTVTGTDKPNMVTPTEDQLESHKVTCGPICREKDTAASSKSKDVVQDQSQTKADVPALQTGPQTKDTGGMKGAESNDMEKKTVSPTQDPRAEEQCDSMSDTSSSPQGNKPQRKSQRKRNKQRK